MKPLRACSIVLLSLLCPFFAYSQGENVKYEIFHVDLVPATFLYGGLELAWSLAMYDALDKTIAAQMEIDTLFRKLVVLEEKTQEYQKNLQTSFVQVLNPDYVDKVISEIHEIQDWIDKYVVFHTQYQELAKTVQTKITDRADNIKRYIDDAAKKTGNAGRLDNKQRNDLNIYVIDELLNLKYIARSIKDELSVVNPSIDETLFIFKTE